MTSLTTSVPVVIPRETVRPLRELCRTVFLVIRFWHERARQRGALSELDDHLLRDIGLTKFDVARECEKPFWQ
jgi:uncharacterized protein YjiS (DUF1127 family)